MKSYTLKDSQRGALNGFTDLFILGATRGTSGASDFTAAATSQSFNLKAMAVGDQVVYPLAAVFTKIAFTGTAISNVKCDVGSTDDADQFVVGTAGDLSTINFSRAALVVSSAAGGPYSPNNATKYVTALVTNGGAGNVTAITAGEVWIYVAIARVKDFLTDRQA
jgi:hypothetical protein